VLGVAVLGHSSDHYSIDFSVDVQLVRNYSSSKPTNQLKHPLMNSNARWFLRVCIDLLMREIK